MRLRRADLTLGWQNCTSRLRNPPYTSVNWGDYAYAYTPSYECIKDDRDRSRLRYPSGAWRSSFKPVTHEKYTFVGDSSLVTYPTDAYNEQTYGGLAALCYSTKSLAEAATRDVSLGAWNFMVSPSLVGLVEDGHYDRWTHVKPSLATRHSLVTMLVELKDFKSMFNILPKRHIKGASCWDDVKWMNGQHLNYNFGVKPFANDIVKLWKGVSSFNSRMSRFYSEAEKELRRRRSDSPVRLSGSVTTARAGSWYSVKYEYAINVSRASAFDYYYDLPYKTFDDLYWRGMLDSLGLSKPLTRVWELSPFSWAVDWFSDVGGALSAAEDDWLQPNLNMVQSCYSRKIEGHVKVSAVAPYAGSVLPAGTLRGTQYARYRGYPHFVSGVSDLNADKIRLGASVVGSLLWKSH